MKRLHYLPMNHARLSLAAIVFCTFTMNATCSAAQLQNTEFAAGDGWSCYGPNAPAKFGMNWESCVSGRTVAKLGPDNYTVEGIYQSATYSSYSIATWDTVRVTIQWLDRSGTNNHQDCQTRVGVDPEGGTDPNDATWSSWTNRPCTPWDTALVEAVRPPGEDTFTVFIESKDLSSSYATGMIDWVSVTRVPAVVTPTPTNTPGGPIPTVTNTPASTDFTFFVWSDTHFDAYNGYNQRNNCVNDMNNLPGTGYPASIGGTVDTPAFVLVTGDVADNGLASQWLDDDSDTNDDFFSCVENLDYPYYVVQGNHDIALNYGADHVIDLHGDVFYSFDYQGVHFVGLNTVGTTPVFPSPQIDWLEDDLDGLTSGTPIILFFHYDPEEEDDDWDELDDAISGYNVIAVLHGHKHNIYKTTWNGYDVYCTGHNKQESAGYEGFGVIHVTDDEVTCLNYDWQDNQWYTDSQYILEITDITGLPRGNNPPAPTPTPPLINRTDVMTNGGLETFTGSDPNQVATGWTAVNVSHSFFRRSPGIHGDGYGQTMERYTGEYDNGSAYVYQQVSVTQGHTYRLTAWGRVDNGGDGDNRTSPPDQAAVQYGIGLDASGGTSWSGLSSGEKVVHDTSQTGWETQAYRKFEIDVAATSSTVTAFLYYNVASWKYRPPRAVWDYVSLVDLSEPTFTPTVAGPTNTPGAATSTFTPTPTTSCGGESIGSLTNLSFQTSWESSEEPPGWDVIQWPEGYGGPRYYTGAELSSGKPSDHRCKYEMTTAPAGNNHVIAKEILWGDAQAVNVSAYCAGRKWSGSDNGTMCIGVDLNGCAESWSDADYYDSRTSNNETWAQVSLSGLSKPQGASSFTLMLRVTRDAIHWNCQFDEVSVTAVTPPTVTPTQGPCGGEELGSLTNMSFQTSWDYSPSPQDPPGWEVLQWQSGGPQYYTGAELSSGRPSDHRCKYEMTSGTPGTEHVLAKEIYWGDATEIDFSAWCAGRKWDGSSNGTMSIGVDLDGCASSWSDADSVVNRTSNDETWSELSLTDLSKPSGATSFTIMLRVNRSGTSWNCQFDEVEVEDSSPQARGPSLMINRIGWNIRENGVCLDG